MLTLVGIVLFAFSLRTAVASFSPVIGEITADFSVPTVVVGLIGAAPPVCYATFAIVTPAMARRVGLQPLVTIAMAVAAVGMISRALATDATGLAVSTVILFAAVGVGNVLLPPVAKKYFPEHIGAITTVYVTAMAVANFITPALAMPIANATHWRMSIGLWALFSLAALVPWILLSVRARADRRAVAIPVVGATSGSVWKTPMAWAIAVIFAATGALAYTMFAWLPQVLVDVAGVTPTAAGALLSVFAFIGLPAAIIAPVVAAKARHGIVILCTIAIGGGLAGLTGLTLAPASATWLWVTLAGLGTALFPLAMALIGLRAGSPLAAVSLSGFVQSVGYGITALFPLMFGVLHAITGGWSAPMLLLVALFVVAIPAAVIVSRPQQVVADHE